MTADQLFVLRNDMAYYACLVCSVAATDKVIATLFLVLALIIFVLEKLKRRAPTAALNADQKEK